MMRFRTIQRQLKRLAFAFIAVGIGSYFIGGTRDLKQTFNNFLEGDFSDVTNAYRDIPTSAKSTLNWVKGLNHGTSKDTPFGFSAFEDSYSSIYGKPDIIWPHYDIQLLDNGVWAVGFSNSLGVPAWVSYKAIATGKHKSDERPTYFDVDPRTDKSIPSNFYTATGYDRGHLFPNYLASVCYGPAVQRDTFLTSNIVPQTPRLNQKIWRLLEEKVGFDYRHDFNEVHVLTGPYYENMDARGKWIGQGNVRVPDGCWKIILVENRKGKRDAMAFMFPQDARSERLETYLVSIDRIESVTGLDFYSELNDSEEIKLEMTKASGVWR